MSKKIVVSAVAAGVALVTGFGAWLLWPHAEPVGHAFSRSVDHEYSGATHKPLGQTQHFGFCAALEPLLSQQPVTLLQAGVGGVRDGVTVTVQIYPNAHNNVGGESTPVPGAQTLAGYVMLPGGPSRNLLVNMTMTKPGLYKTGPLWLRYRVGGRTYRQTFDCDYIVSTGDIPHSIEP